MQMTAASDGHYKMKIKSENKISMRKLLAQQKKKLHENIFNIQGNISK